VANVALASNGATATASSDGGAGFAPSHAINGNITGFEWGINGGWNDGTISTFDDWLEVAFSGSKTIDQIDVITIQDAFETPTTPVVDVTTFATYGITSYEVQYWTGAAWTTVTGGNVTGNNKVWRRFTFTAVTTTKIRILVHASADGNYSRLVEVQAWEYVPPAAPPVGLTINGVDKSLFLKRGSVDGSHVLGARATLGLVVVDPLSTASAYRPVLGQSLSLFDGLTYAFSGRIISVEDLPASRPSTGTLTRIQAVDQSAKFGAVTVTKTYVTGQTLKAIVTDILAGLHASVGITLDAGMANGPTLAEVKFDTAYVEDALNYLATVTGWLWYVSATNVLFFFAPGTKISTFDLTLANGKAIRQASWSKSRGTYFNKVHVRAGAGTADKSENFVGNGANRTFLAGYPVGATYGYVTITGPHTPNGYRPLGLYGVDTIEWLWDPATNSVKQHTSFTPLSSSDTLTFTYQAKFPFTVTAEDAADITAKGLYEYVTTAPEIFDKAAAQSLADGLLRRFMGEPRKVLMETREGFVQPGYTITLTEANRLISGSHLVMGCKVRDDVDGRFSFRLECLSGAEAGQTWVDYFKALAGGGVSGGSTITGSGTIPPVTSGGVAPLGYFLGGNGTEAVRSATPTWVPASGGGVSGQAAIQVRLDPAIRGTNVVTITARLRALDSGVSVTARLFNVTDGVSAGASSLITSTSWTTVVFTATLATGLKVYEIQVLPSVADKDVMATGQLE
jgi:hypothetical protein